jgi:hypothetical protein
LTLQKSVKSDNLRLGAARVRLKFVNGRLGNMEAPNGPRTAAQALVDQLIVNGVRQTKPRWPRLNRFVASPASR